MRKNVASQKIGAQLITAADGTAFTGSVTVSVTGDAGTQATGSVGSGACTHEGNGYHTYAPAQAETNYDLIAFTFTGTGAIPVTVQVYTRWDANATHLLGTAWLPPQTAGTPDVNVVQWNELATVALPLTPTTAGRTLDVSAGGEAGVDWANVGTPGSTVSLSATTVATVTTTGTATNVTTVNGLAANVITATSIQNDAITAAKIAAGAIDAATFAADVDAEILSYLVDDATRIDASALNTASGAIGADGAGLTEAGGTGDHLTALATAAELAKVPKSDGTATWNATALASIQTEANDALVANNLDHLVLSAVDTDFATTVHLNSVIGHLADNGTSASYDRTTDSLEANRDNVGTAGAGLTAADDAVISAIGALNNITAASVWAVATRVLTAGTNIQLPANGLANVTAWTVDITGNLSGSVGSVTGSVGSVTGNVGGNVVGSAASVVGAVGSVTGNVGGNVSGSVGSVVGAVGSVTGAVGSVTGNVGGNVTGSVGSVLGGINTTGGTITTLDALDTAQDAQHTTTQGLVTTADTVVDAIKVKTDQLAFGVANTVNANITSVNETAVGGTGASGDEWGPA